MAPIQRRHWNGVAKANGMGENFEMSLRGLDAAPKRETRNGPCSIGSPGRITRRFAPRPFGVALRALNFGCGEVPLHGVRTGLVCLSAVRIGGDGLGEARCGVGNFVKFGSPGRITRRFAPRPFGVALRALNFACGEVVEPGLFVCRRFE